MWQIVSLIQIVIAFIAQNPEFVDKIKEIIEAIREEISGGTSVTLMQAEDQAECVYIKVFGNVEAQDAESRQQRRQWLELIKLIFENWDKLAPIFFK
jgi:C4-type Zn-finger protein